MISLPQRRQAIVCILILVVWLAVTAAFIGFRPEHPFLALLLFALFFVNGFTRRLVVALLPFIVFGISYDWMNILPNYEVNPIDVRGLYEQEKAWFGIVFNSEVITPNEFFAIHNWPLADFFAGVFYLCWVPLPIFFGLWLYFTGKRRPYLHFALVFLLVNFIGFAIYYIHPAAPPWYVQLHGFEPILSTHGEVAGLGRFDSMVGLGIFDSLYSRNSNVFAAVPSLHSAYTFVALIYSFRARSSVAWKVILGIVTLGIWCTAVYTSHHYIIDVLLGISTSLVGFVLFEYVFMRFAGFRRFIDGYVRYITPA